jgi:hypothetical protein
VLEALVVGQFVHSALPPAPFASSQKTRRLAGFRWRREKYVGPHRHLSDKVCD